MKVIFNDCFFKTINDKRLFNKIVNDLMLSVERKLVCSANRTKGGIEIKPLYVTIDKDTISEIIDMLIEDLCGDDIKLLNELGSKDYFYIV